jgi:hypothetical protein
MSAPDRTRPGELSDCACGVLLLVWRRLVLDNLATRHWDPELAPRGRES